MTRLRMALAFPLIALSVTLAAAGGPDDKPKQDLPRLPPPEKDKPAAKAGPAAKVTRIPLEFTIDVADLEKQMLREIVKKIDPKADPKAEVKLPIVVKGNEPNFAVAGEAKAEKPVLDAAREVRENLQQMRANRPRLMAPRLLPGPRLRPRVAERPRLGEFLGTIMASQAAEIFRALVIGNVDLVYRVELRSFSLSVEGNTLTCEVGGGFHCEGRPAQMGPAPPVAPNVRDISVKLITTKDLVWSDGGKLELKGGTSRVWIDPNAPVIGFPRLNIERVLRLNGLLGLLDGVLDRELMKRIPTENLPDLAAVAPKVKEKLPFLALAEITAYPLRGDGKQLVVPLEVGLVPANQKPEEVTVTAESGPAPKPQVRGRIVFDKDGKPDVKLDPIR
jgi:hypothetical protein